MNFWFCHFVCCILSNKHSFHPTKLISWQFFRHNKLLIRIVQTSFRYRELWNWKWTLKLKATQNINVIQTNSIWSIWYSLIVWFKYVIGQNKLRKSLYAPLAKIFSKAIYSCNIDLYVYLVHSYVVVRLPEVVFYSISFSFYLMNNNV